MSPPEPDPLQKEIDAALEGVDLQEIDQPARRGGERVYHGVVVGVSGDDVFVELGPRSQGVAPATEFEEPPVVGQRYEFTMRGRDDDLVLLSRSAARALAAWDEMEPGDAVEAKVTGQNTGGLELRIGPMAAFMPASHAALRRVEDLSVFIGQKLECEVLEVDRGKKRVLLSRRRILEREERAAREQASEHLGPGTRVHGKVTRVESFGAFVDIGSGLEGLVHVSEISRKRVDDPTTVIQVGQEIDAEIVKVEEGGRRIGLSMKRLEPDPWDGVEARYSVDSVVTGRVVRLAEFGAFVELEPGLEGLLHVSQLGPNRVRHAKDAVKMDEELAVRIQAIDFPARRMSLSRLDRRGALIGSDESVDDSAIEDAMSGGGTNLGTNLGSLFKKALEDKQD